MANWLAAIFQSPLIEDRSVRSKLRFIRPLDRYLTEKPFRFGFSVKSIENIEETNIEYEEVEVQIHDLRGREGSFDIEKNGFEIIRHKSLLCISDFQSHDMIEREYIPEVTELFQERFNAQKVVILGWVVR